MKFEDEYLISVLKKPKQTTITLFLLRTYYMIILHRIFFFTFLNYRVKMPTADFTYQRPIPVDILYKPYLKTWNLWIEMDRSLTNHLNQKNHSGGDLR